MEKHKNFQIKRLFADGRPVVNFRPAAVCAAALGAGVYFARILGTAGSLFGAALFLCLAAAAYLLGFRRAALAAAAMLIGMLRIACFPMEIPAAGAYHMEGIVAETPSDTAGQTELILRQVSLDGEPVSGKIRLILRNESRRIYRYGDMITADAEITIPRRAMNEGDMDLNAYYRGQGIVAFAYAENADASAGRTDIYGWCLALRDKLMEAIGELYPQRHGVVAGLLLGEKDAIPSADMQAFRDTGAAHLLAISGLHISIFAAAVSTVLRRFSAKLQFAALGAFLLIYSAVTGFAPSVVRAAVMAMTAAMARLLGRRYDAPSALSAAFILLLLAEPYSLFQTGFQLSFSAVAGILLLRALGIVGGIYSAVAGGTVFAVSDGIPAFIFCCGGDIAPSAGVFQSDGRVIYAAAGCACRFACRLHRDRSRYDGYVSPPAVVRLAGKFAGGSSCSADPAPCAGIRLPVRYSSGIGADRCAAGQVPDRYSARSDTLRVVYPRRDAPYGGAADCGVYSLWAVLPVHIGFFSAPAARPAVLRRGGGSAGGRHIFRAAVYRAGYGDHGLIPAKCGRDDPAEGRRDDIAGSRQRRRYAGNGLALRQRNHSGGRCVCFRRGAGPGGGRRGGGERDRICVFIRKRYGRQGYFDTKSDVLPHVPKG